MIRIEQSEWSKLCRLLNASAATPEDVVFDAMLDELRAYRRVLAAKASKRSARAESPLEFLVTFSTAKGSVQARCETENLARALVNLVPGDLLEGALIHSIRGSAIQELLLELGLAE